MLVNEKSPEATVIDMSGAKYIKLRFVSMVALLNFRLWIEGHDMYVVEADGVCSIFYRFIQLKYASG